MLFLFAFIAVASAGAVRAQSSTATGAVSGYVRADGQPIPGAVVTATGPKKISTVTDARGAFTLTLAPGLYAIGVSKTGFQPAVDSNVALLNGQAVQLAIELQPASFSSLKQIASVRAVAGSSNSINTSSAAIVSVSQSTFTDQGQLSVNRVLNQIPGIVVSPGNGIGIDGIANGASPLATGIPQIRGALPYETESLIDGHPISIGEYGTFNPSFLNPYLLQSVEVVKGPGASPANINGAIGGTVNFITLQPTVKPQASIDVGINQLGGTFSNLRATGTLSRLSYAFDDAAQGTSGYDQNFRPLMPVYASGEYTINGVPACASAANAAGCYLGFEPGDPTYAGSATLTTPLMLCCPSIPMWSNERNELAKIRYTLTPTTALTISYLGSQTRGADAGGLLYSYPSFFFQAPTGYTGAYNGAATPFDVQNTGVLTNNSNLFQADFRTAVGAITFLARAYTTSVSTFEGGPGDGATPGTMSFTGQLYGGVPLGSDTNPTFFNGESATVTYLNDYYATRTLDDLHGYTFEADIPVSGNQLSLSYDQSSTTSSGATTASIPALDSVAVPVGSGQTFRTVMLRYETQLTQALQATISDHQVSYTDHYSQDGGVTFGDSTHAANIPRVAFVYTPKANLAVRASAGYSIAPPYISLLTNTYAPQADQYPPQYFTATGNSGDVSPETSFGWDLGADLRVAANTIASLDFYQTTLHNQFLQTTSLTGTYTTPAGFPFPGTYPLYTTSTKNLGHSRYEGIEVALHAAPAFGVGYILQGVLQRAYPYDLPAGFFDSAVGPNTVNLAVLPNVNFQATGQGYNGLSYSRVPYSQGYAEINFRTRHGGYALLGLTYYGPNNAYNEPPFGVVNASVDQRLSHHLSAMLTVTNLTDAYSNYYYNIYGGIPTPLVNGQLGYTAANVIGPRMVGLSLHMDL